MAQRIAVPDVAPPGKLVDVAVQVLGAELVKRPVIAALDHTPERVSSLCRGLALDILANGVLNGLVPRQPAIAGVIVGIDGGIWRGVVLEKAV